MRNVKVWLFAAFVLGALSGTAVFNAVQSASEAQPVARAKQPTWNWKPSGLAKVCSWACPTSVRAATLVIG